MHLGQYERARALGRRRSTFSKSGVSNGTWTSTLICWAWWPCPGRRTRRPTVCYKQSICQFREFGVRLYLANTEAVMGYAARGIGQPDQARGHLAEALRLGREQDSWPPVVLALPAIALLWPTGERQNVQSSCTPWPRTFPYEPNSRWFEDVAGREIDALAATLPPEVVAAAQERGRARDLWATVEELLGELGE